MTTDKDAATSEWALRLRGASSLLKAVSNFVTKAAKDPFESQRDLQGLIEKLKAAHLDALSPPPHVMQELEAQCVSLKARFWDELAIECKQRGWELHGTTARRLLNRGFFIEACDDEVVIETLAGMQTFHVPSIMRELEPLVGTLSTSQQDKQKLLDFVECALESLGGGERPLEEVYRRTLWYAQKATFWRTLSPQQFVRITRPQFRWWLSDALELGMRTPSGRELRFGTTVQPKEAWEIFSPGEGRVVQVGRVALL